MWSRLLETLNDCRKTYVQVRVVQKRKFPKWMNKKLHPCVKERNKARAEFNESPDYEKEYKYKVLRNNITREIRKAKKCFEEQLARRRRRITNL